MTSAPIRPTDADRRDLAVIGRIGGYVLRATHDPREYTANARSAFLDRFLPDDPALTPQERQKRGEAALKAHMLKLAYKSAKKRRQKAARQGTTP